MILLFIDYQDDKEHPEDKVSSKSKASEKIFNDFTHFLPFSTLSLLFCERCNFLCRGQISYQSLKMSFGKVKKKKVRGEGKTEHMNAVMMILRFTDNRSLNSPKKSQIINIYT